MQPTKMLAAAVLLKNHHTQVLEKQALKPKDVGNSWSWGKKLLGLGDDAARAVKATDDLILRGQRAATRPGPLRGYGSNKAPRVEGPVPPSSPGPMGGNAPTPRATPPPLPAPAAATTAPAATAAATAAPAATATAPAAPTLTDEAMKSMTGKGGKYWGSKPSVEQLNAGNRPFSLDPRKSGLNPLRDRTYANDKSLTNRVVKGTLGTLGVAGVGGTVDNVVNTPKRMRRAGEVASAMTIQELQKGTTWEKLLRVLGLTFGSDNAIFEQLSKIKPGVANMYKHMRETGWRPGEKGHGYEDIKKLYLGQ